MDSAAHALLAAWESYYVILGGSAAALTGLQFVVIAVIADTPELTSEDSVAAFGTPTVVHFCLCLLLSALLSAPWTSLRPVAGLLLAAGIAGILYTLVVVRRARRQTTYQPVHEDWLWHAILPILTYAVLIGAGASLTRAPVVALFLAGGVALGLIFIGIHNAWDAVAYVATQVRGKPKA